MSDKHLKNIKESIRIAGKSMRIFEGQINNLEANLNGVINNLDGKDKQKIQQLKAMINIAFNKAKSGGDYNEVIEKIKETFKDDISNGGKSS